LADATVEIIGARPERGQVTDRRDLASKRIKRLAQDGRCVFNEGLERDHRLRSAFHGDVARHLETADHLDGARAGFGSRISLTTQYGPRRTFGIEGITLAMLMAELAIGTVHPPLKLAAIPALMSPLLLFAACASYAPNSLPGGVDLRDKPILLTVSPADIPLPVLRTRRFDLAPPRHRRGRDPAVVANPDLRAARARLGVSRAQAFAGVGMPARSASVSWPTSPPCGHCLPCRWSPARCGQRGSRCEIARNSGSDSHSTMSAGRLLLIRKRGKRHASDSNSRP